QGQLMLLSAFIVAKWEATRGVPVGIAILVAVVAPVLICVVFYLVVLQRMMGLPPFIGFVATLGLASVLDGAMGLIFGSNQYFLKFPGLSAGAVDIFGGRIATCTIVV